ncbi:MAG: hypothetical protein VKM98_02395, partial [Cyanobacteriota bacterium]|nr:hypothetical protein [Cyanobacteriota bacterium]
CSFAVCPQPLMESLDIAALPEGPLSMSRLVALEPQPLRRILKAGLRSGIEDAELKQLMRKWLPSTQADAALEQILMALETRGWLVRFGDRWKTRLD